MPAYLWVWGFGFFSGFNDLEREGILIWVWGCFVSSFGRSKGWIFGLGVAALLRWDVGGYAFFFFFHLCVLHLHSQKAIMGVVARGGNYWLNHAVLAMVVVLVACVEL